jgi:hypothetical protein
MCLANRALPHRPGKSERLISGVDERYAFAGELDGVGVARQTRATRRPARITSGGFSCRSAQVPFVVRDGQPRSD